MTNVFDLLRAARPSGRLAGACFAVAMGLAAGVAPSRAVAASPEVIAIDKLNEDGQSFLRQRNFSAAVAKHNEAAGLAERLSQPAVRLHYLALTHMDLANDLSLLGRFAEALTHADYALRMMTDPQNTISSAGLRLMIHHARGAALYYLGRLDEAQAMFTVAAQEGDPKARDWLKQIGDRRAALQALARASETERRGDLRGALASYTASLQNYEAVGGELGGVLDRAIAVALAMRPPPPIPAEASRQVALADAGVGAGTQRDLATAHREYVSALAQAPWWADCWRKLAALDERLGSAAAARVALQYYLRAAPDAPDRAAMEQKIAELQTKAGR